MTRSAALLGFAVLAGCSAASAPSGSVSTPIHGDTPGHRCTTAETDQFVGRSVTGDIGTEILRVSNAAVLRWAAPGTMLTMDFRADRVTVYYGPNGVITKIACG